MGLSSQVSTVRNRSHAVGLPKRVSVATPHSILEPARRAFGSQLLSPPRHSVRDARKV
jgi:hypothetical protein